MTPGKNEKRYFPAAIDAKTELINWGGDRTKKKSQLFL
jgi:hypothetical protein